MAEARRGIFVGLSFYIAIAIAKCYSYKHENEQRYQTVYLCMYLACDRGAVVAFLNEGQIGCFKEERLVGDTNVGSILKVRWSEKETYDARVLFFGKLLMAMVAACIAHKLII